MVIAKAVPNGAWCKYQLFSRVWMYYPKWHKGRLPPIPTHRVLQACIAGEIFAAAAEKPL